VKFIISIFKLPTPDALARRQLLSAERELLEAQDTLEYAHKMCEYNVTRIKRLREQLGVKA
jgi:hypothetical protein